MFPRKEIYTVRQDELKLIYAVLKRVPVAPVKEMVEHWLSVPELVGDIECASLVTRIANNLGLLTNAVVSYLDEPRSYIDYFYFIF